MGFWGHSVYFVPFSDARCFLVFTVTVGGWDGIIKVSLNLLPLLLPFSFNWCLSADESLLLISRVLGKFIWTIFISVLICFLNGEMDVQRSFLCCSTNRRSLKLISHIVCFSRRSNEVHGISFYSLTIFIFPITKCLLKPFFPLGGYWVVCLFKLISTGSYILWLQIFWIMCVCVYNHTFSQLICLVVFFNVTMVGRYQIVSDCLSWLLLLVFVMISMSFS